MDKIKSYILDNSQNPCYFTTKEENVKPLNQHHFHLKEKVCNTEKLNCFWFKPHDSKDEEYEMGDVLKSGKTGHTYEELDIEKSYDLLYCIEEKSALNNTFVYSHDEEIISNFIKYKKELRQLKNEDKIEEIGELRREHILTAISVMKNNIINNLGNHGKTTISFDDKFHNYDTNELLYEVLEAMIEKMRKDK